MKKIIEVDSREFYNNLFSMNPIFDKNTQDIILYENTISHSDLYFLNILNKEESDYFMNVYSKYSLENKIKIDEILWADSLDCNSIELFKKAFTEDLENIFKEMPYNIFLNTYYWQSISNYKKQQSNNKCQLCSSKLLLNTHHNNYKNKGSEYRNLNDLIVLCNKCHVNFHKNKDKKDE